MTDSERERIRKEKMRELKKQAKESTQDDNEQPNNQTEDAVFKQATTSDARQRLNAVKMTKSELAEEVKRQIVSAYQAGRISDTIDDSRMKELLSKAHDQTTQDFTIRRR